MNASIAGALLLVARKLLTAFVQLLVVATLIFSVMYIMPGDPVLLLLGADSNPSPEAIAAMRSQLGLDQPVLSQYFVWLWNALHLDFGKSLTNGYPVANYVMQNLPRTLELAVAAIIIAALIGVPLGIAAALKRGSMRDTVLTSIATIGISVPVYIVGTLLVLFFSLKLGWLPASGYTDISRNVLEHFRKLALPAFALGLGLSASIARMTRSSVLEILGRDFVRALRAKGMSERRIIWQHVLRNAAIPIVTIIGLQLGNLMGGTVLVEAMFNWPGLSTLLVGAVSARNYPLVQGAMLAIAAAFILINLVVELLYSLLDPPHPEEALVIPAAILRATRSQPAFLASIVLLVAVVLIGVFGSWLAPQDPFLLDPQSVNQGSSAAHWLGTDEFGRDLLSRLLIGVQPTLLVAIGATAIAGVFGTMVGIAGAYGRPLVQFLIMRSVDIMLSFPPILLALLAVGFWESGVLSLAVVIGVLYIPHFARVAHAATLQVSRMEFMEAEHAMGASAGRVVFTAILPNILSPLVVQATLTVAAAILLESGLSFLGLGIVPPEPSWGQMIGTARGYLGQNPMYVIWPSLLLALTVLAINVVGDRLRDILDPRLREE